MSAAEGYDWRQFGTCTRQDPDLMFPDPDDQVGVARAQQVCRAGCPVLEQCHAWALATSPTDGVWAALTPGAIPRARAAALRKAQRAAKRAREATQGAREAVAGAA